MSPDRDDAPFGRWSHRRDPDLDELEDGDGPGRTPAGDPGRPQLPSGASRYGWFVGVVGILLLAYISLNTLRTGSLETGVATGTRLPPFAVPRLASSLDGDANLARRTGTGAGRSGRVTACEVRDPRAFNLCTFARGRPFVLVFASIEDGGSRRQLDVLARLRRRFPGVGFAAVMLRGDRGRARRAARKRGWDFDIGWDRHADVAAAYGVKSLPAIVFADAHRKVARRTSYRVLAGPQLAARLRRLER